MVETPPDTDVPTRVFLSYARRDTALMVQIADALRERGFEPDFDQSSHDPENVTGGISAEDEWWLRLQEMIATCDVVVFLASAASAASEVCDEELVYARQAGKRIIPVLAGQIDFASAPPRLAALNVKIDVTQEGQAFDAAIDTLQAALNLNVGWRREGRRLADRMAEWDRRERPASLLLRPGAVEDAEAWAARRPRNEPEPGEIYFDYVAASRDRNRADENRRAFLRRVTSVLVLVAMGLMGWGLYATVQTQRSAQVNYSQFLTQASIEALDAGRTAQAMRLSILAAKDTVLSPAAKGAQFQLGKAAIGAHIAVRLPDKSASRDRPLYSPTTDEVAVPSGTNGVQIWRPDVDGVWSSITLPTRSENPDILDYSADGASLFTASHMADDAEVWRKNSDGVWTATALDGHLAGVSAAAFSPDSAMLVTATGSFRTDEYLIRVWQRSEAGEWYSTVLDGHTGYITSVSFSSDGDRFATSSRDETVRVWRAGEDGVWASSTLQGPPNNPIETVAFSPIRHELVAISGTVRLWRETSGGAWVDITPGDFPERADRAHFSPDGDHLAVYDVIERATTIWRRDAVGAWSPDGRCLLYPIAFAPDGALYCSRTGANAVSVEALRRTKDGEWTRTSLGSLGTNFSAQSFSFDGTRVAVRTGEGPVLIAPLTQRSPQPVAELVGHEDYLTVARFSADGHRIVTASEDATARVWEKDEHGSWSAAVLEMPRVEANVTAAAFAPDGERVVTGAFDRLWLWHHDGDGAWTLEATLEGHDWPITSAVFSPDGEQILSASEDRSARIWTQTEPGSWSAEVLTGHSRAVRSAAFSPDGRTIVTASDDEVAVLWRLDETEQAWTPYHALGGHEEAVVSAAFSAAGDRIITESAKSVRLWEQDGDGIWRGAGMVDQGVVAQGGDGLTVGGGGAAFSPQGDRLLTLSEFAGVVTLWSRDRDGLWLSASVPGASSGRAATAFAPDGRTIITADEDHIARIWDISWLTPDGARSNGPIFASGPTRSIVDEACGMLQSASVIEAPNSTGEAERTNSQARITAVDIEAAPILRTIGADIGVDVCELVRPGLVDRTLTAVFAALQ